MHTMKKLDGEALNRIMKRVKWIYGYGKKHFFSIIIYTVIGMSGAAAVLMGSLVSKDLVDIITGHKTGELIRTFCMLIGVQLGIVALNNLSSYISMLINLKVENEIKADVYDKIMITDWESLSKYHSGHIMARWSGDCSSVAAGILNTIPNACVYTFKFCSAFYMVVKYDWTFALIALASVPVSFLVSRRNLKRMRNANMGAMEFTAKMSSFTQESFSNIQNVKAFDMIGLYCDRLRELQKENNGIKTRYQKVTIINSIILTLVSNVITYLIYGWGVYRVWSGDITYGTMTMFLALSNTLSGTTQSLIGLIPSTINLTNAAARIMDVLDLPREDYSMSTEVAEFYDRNRNKGIGVKLKNTSFDYMSGTEVFHNVCFEAYPREVVGLVGPSGEGKTTMLRLMLAIINAYEGENKLVVGDGSKGFESMPITASTRQLFAYVPQGNSMFPGTIADNMRNVKKDATDEEIIEALKKACAWDFVSRLPDGINTTIKERGTGFSEGQSQRLSIARALLRNSPILLLDEATSALDADTASRVLKNIISDEHPRTCILTTHRLEVMDICDRKYTVSGLNVKEEV